MDWIQDALLEDLRVTKQHVLQQGLPIFSTNGNGAATDPKLWSPNSATLSDVRQKSRPSISMPRRPLQENLAKLDRILSDLDEMDGDSDEFGLQDTSPCINCEVKSEKFETSEVGLPDGTKTTDGEAIDSMSQKTKEAAAHASKQLDELMASLQQLKQHPPTGGKLPYNQHLQPTSSPSAQRSPLSQKASAFVEEPVDEVTKPRQQTPTDNTHYPRKQSSSNSTSSRPNSSDVTSPRTGYCGSLCLHCNQPVIGKVITALGGVWHPEHFNCAYCRKNVVEEFFYEHDGAPYCTECHLSLFAPKCAFCGEAIVDRCLEAMGYFWHPDHFFCQGCHTPFVDNATAHEHQGKVFCPNCYYSKFGERCGGCRKPITDAYITALEQPWHEDCFKCKDCGLKLTGRSFYAENGYLYCEQHHRRNLGMVCAACQEPISGSRCINALGNRYHPQHFVCTYCLRQLSTGTFKERLGKPYCDSCFRQLFG
ncbi:Paxillin [Echinococcus granulosus]|uniref:Paxillin n=1 Tax=Echinococcus granulosus TaxID=6210 RepID=W6URM6_ECHGR|nr:Paxillin [Echinococcus granulosus]EUB60957.1 Paxillin [Echinococcus granulosus]